jgi:hypothetical protein
MLVFLDTEFTDLDSPRLISIGLVAQDGQQFYGEMTDWQLQECSSFVIEAILPYLEGGAATISRETLQERLRSWLNAFDEPVTLISDSSMDWRLISELDLAGTRSEWQLFQPELAKPGQAKYEATAAIEHYHQEHPWHHALHDAIGLQKAWFAARSCGWKPAWLRT